MDITAFIRELIIQNECVILRGVGGFETSYKHATLDSEKKVINPPTKKINFRPDLIKDNGVLEDYLVRQLETEKSKASVIIDDFVRWFYDTIKEEGKVFLEGIGEFRFDGKNNIVFSEIENENYLAESFGLGTLVFDNGFSSGNDKTPNAGPTPVLPQKRKLTGWYIAIGILLLLISVTTLVLLATSHGMPLVQWFDSKLKERRQEEMVFGNSKKEWEDSIINEIERSLNESTQAKKALAVPRGKGPEKFLDIQSSSPGYHLVAGSFRNRRNADLLSDQLYRKGFRPEIRSVGQDYYRVVIGSFYDRKEAIAELRRIRSQIDQSVWLLEEK
ncbi:MAG: SPOR domain-containing protein [Bacteroidales bacterium]